MFKLMQSPAYWWPVTVRQPAEDDPGKFVSTTFEVKFTRKTADEQQAWLDDTRTALRTDADYVRLPHGEPPSPLVVGFRKVFLMDDSEVAFADTTLAQLLQVPGVGTAIAKAYLESNDQAAAKN